MSKLLWTQKQDIGPAPRFNHAMAFDQSRQRVLLFGGEGAGQFFKDTWEWNGDHWTQVEDIGPSARSAHALVYDSNRNRTVLFGGRATATSALNDTWEWDGTSWTQVQDTGPGPRRFHQMVFDSARKRVVLFGGAGADDAPYGDTWEWDGDNWTQVDDSGPSPRSGHAMTYDSVRSRIVLFGGAGGAPGGLADTWERDADSWTEMQEIGPPAAIQAALAFRSTVSALFGGSSTRDPQANPQVFGVTWEWDGAHWTARQDMGVSARFGHAMAFDTVRRRVVLFGGLGQPDNGQPDAGPTKGDTWEHADTTATPQGPQLLAIDTSPNTTIAPGEMLTILAQLGGPLNTPTSVDVKFGGSLTTVPGMPLTAVVSIPAMTLGGSTTVQIPSDVLVPLPAVLTVTASIAGGPELFKNLTVQS